MSYQVVSQFILIIGLLAVGYACRKLGVIDQDAGQKLSKVLLSLTIPATSISAAIGQPLDNLNDVLLVVGIAAATFVAVPLVGKALCALLRWNDVYRLMLTFGNTGFVGIPVVSALYGADMVFYVTMYIMVFNIAFFTWGVATMKRASGYGVEKTAGLDAGAGAGAGAGASAGAAAGVGAGASTGASASAAAGAAKSGRRRRRTKSSFCLRDLLSPGIVSALIAVVIFAFQIPVQADIRNVIDSVASINTPLAMLVIGASLASVPVREIFTTGALYVFVFIKQLVVLPAITLGVLLLCGVPMPIISMFVVLECMPVAGNLSMIAIQYHGDIELVSKATAISTILFVPAVLGWASVLAALG